MANNINLQLELAAQTVATKLNRSTVIIAAKERVARGLVVVDCDVSAFMMTQGTSGAVLMSIAEAMVRSAKEWIAAKKCDCDVCAENLAALDVAHKALRETDAEGATIQ